MKKTILITGANGGIGDAIIEKFLSENWNVIGLDVNKSKRINSDNFISTICNVTNYNELEKVFEQGIKKFGSIDLVINSAGIMALETLEKQDVKTIDLAIDINIKGVVYGTKIAIEKFKQNKIKGDVINLASTASFNNLPARSIYCGSKVFVRNFTETVRREVLLDGIRLMSISPGIVDTALLDNGTKNEQINKNYKKYKLERQAFIKPEELASIIFQMTSAPRRINWRNIVVSPTTQDN